MDVNLIPDHPFVVIAICERPDDMWFAACKTREGAISGFTMGLQGNTMAKPLYRVVAHFDGEKVRRDLSLYNVPVQGTA